MTEAARYYLTSPIYRQNAIAAVKKAADGLVVTIAPENYELLVIQLLIWLAALAWGFSYFGFIS